MSIQSYAFFPKAAREHDSAELSLICGSLTRRHRRLQPPLLGTASSRHAVGLHIGNIIITLILQHGIGDPGMRPIGPHRGRVLPGQRSRTGRDPVTLYRRVTNHALYPGVPYLRASLLFFCARKMPPTRGRGGNPIANPLASPHPCLVCFWLSQSCDG